MSKKLMIRAIMEILGSPKDHVEKTAKLVLDKVKERSDIELIKSYISDSKQVKQFWSCFVEVEMRIENIDKLIGFCFDFMPSSIDILEPSTLEMPAREVNGFINDLMARLHRYDMFLKNLRAHALMLQEELDKKKK